MEMQNTNSTDRQTSPKQVRPLQSRAVEQRRERVSDRAVTISRNRKTEPDIELTLIKSTATAAVVAVCSL